MAQGFSPVIGLSIILLEIPIKKWYLTFIKTVLPSLGIAYCISGQISHYAFPDYWQIFLYSIVISLFLHFLQRKYPDKNAKVLGVVFIVNHLFSQYWEIPFFIMVHIGILGIGYLGSIDQLYLILVFYLALKFSNISIAKGDLIILLTPLVFTTISYLLDPVIYSYVPPQWFIVRCVNCFCLGKFFLERSEL